MGSEMCIRDRFLSSDVETDCESCASSPQEYTDNTIAANSLILVCMMLNLVEVNILINENSSNRFTLTRPQTMQESLAPVRRY